MTYGCVSPRVLAVAVVFSALLAACGGGGGGGGGTSGGSDPVPNVSSTPTQTPPAPGAPNTNASGTVVDDQTGNPLAGVPVKVMPWGPCGATPAPSVITPENDGCPTPLPSPQATTNANGGFTLGGIPNGHYILVIGADAVATPPAGYSPSTCNPCSATPSPAPFTVQATVHDNVTFNGGNVTLVAPTIPPIPTITPKPWEVNGDYRIATLDASIEMPCYIAWQYQRGLRSLPLGTVDEWLMEQVRGLNLAEQTDAAIGVKFLTSGGTQSNGGTTCDASVVDTFAFANVVPYATDLRTLWFGGQYRFYFPGDAYSADGLAEFPIDPRSFIDPNISNWL